MLIKSAKFLMSNVELAKCPPATLPEYAFIGRSNVGKSSLINMLVNQKDLAKTSGKPGKTQLINHFIVNDNWYLVDLPGYGFAKVSKDKSEQFEKLITEYLLKRTNLLCIFVLIDIRLPLQQIDKEFFDWCGKKEIPFAIVYTKSDKLTKAELQKSLDFYQAQLLRYWEELPSSFLTSAVSRIGKEDILSFIGETNKMFKP
jgi:GTP-binding protein